MIDTKVQSCIMFPRLYCLEGLRCKQVFGGITEGARRATGVIPLRPLRLDILSVLAYETTRRHTYGRIAR